MSRSGGRGSHRDTGKEVAPGQPSLFLVLINTLSVSAIALHPAAGPAGQLVAQESDGPSGRSARVTVDIVRAAAPVSVDGQLGEEVWARAPVVPLGYEVTPGDNTPAAVQTHCRLAFDSELLYFGCEAFDPRPGEIRAFITDRDDVDGQDRISLVLDPFNDARRAFRFTVTPLGVQLDGLVDQQQVVDVTWDAIWASGGRITPSGYQVEGAIPFKSLSFPDTPQPQTWGIYLERRWPRSDDVQILSMPWDRGDACFLCQANLLRGLQGIRPGRNVEVTPSMTTTRRDEPRVGSGAGLQPGDVEAEPALDLRWNPSSDMALNGTLNPDFSQVEADVAQLEVNNRFALFFPEKRPFFLEGADLFTTLERTVLTRTIADPSVGAKVTGKLGASAIGAIVARDEVTNLLFPGRESSEAGFLDRAATTVIGRYRRDVGASSTVGALFTGREGPGYHNRLISFDGGFQPHPTTHVRLQLARSTTEYPDSLATVHGQPSGTFSGGMGMARADYSSRHWAAQARLGFHAPELRTDAGFISQVGMRQAWLSVDRIFWGRQGSWFTRLFVRAGYWRRQGYVDGLIGDDLWMHIDYTGPLQSSVLIIPRKLRVSFADRVHDVSDFNVITNFRPSAAITAGFTWNIGGGIDVVNGRRADRWNVRPSIGMRVGRGLELTLASNFQRLAHRGNRIFDASVTELRATYNLDVRTFLRVIAQYRTTSRNPGEHPAGTPLSDRTLDTQLLFSYKLNPSSVLFVGYDDVRQGRTELELVEVPLTQTRRTFFVKVSYAWRP